MNFPSNMFLITDDKQFAATFFTQFQYKRSVSVISHITAMSYLVDPPEALQILSQTRTAQKKEVLIWINTTTSIF